MSRLCSMISLALVAVLGLLLSVGCTRTVDPKVASRGLALALDLRVDHAEIAAHFAELKEEISLEKGKLKFKELRRDELESKTWCFMKYSLGEAQWGIVPGTERDCTDDDDDDEKKRAKRRAKRWLASQTEAAEVRSEIDYLLTDGGYRRGVSASAQSAVTGFDFGACVNDAVEVEVSLRRRLAEERCETLMDNEEIDVPGVLGSTGLERLGVALDDVDDEDVEKAMKKFVGKLGELTGDDGATFLMIANEGWGTACFEHQYLADDTTARALVVRKAMELCADVAEAASGGD